MSSLLDAVIMLVIALLYLAAFLLYIGATNLIQTLLLNKVREMKVVSNCIYKHDAVRVYMPFFYIIVFSVSAASIYGYAYYRDFNTWDVVWFCFMYAMFWPARCGADALGWRDYAYKNKVKITEAGGVKTVYVSNRVSEDMLERIQNGEDVGKYL